MTARRVLDIWEIQPHIYPKCTLHDCPIQDQDQVS